MTTGNQRPSYGLQTLRYQWNVRRTLTLSLFLALAGCGAAHSPEQALISEIELKVRLPFGALPLKSYARAYAYGPNRTVRGVYFKPLDPVPGCLELTAKEPQGGQRALLCPPPQGMSANERRWFSNYELLPDFTDGGCARIQITYHRDAQVLDSVQCDFGL